MGRTVYFPTFAISINHSCRYNDPCTKGFFKDRNQFWNRDSASRNFSSIVESFRGQKPLPGRTRRRHDVIIVIPPYSEYSKLEVGQILNIQNFLINKWEQEQYIMLNSEKYCSEIFEILNLMYIVFHNFNWRGLFLYYWKNLTFWFCFSIFLVKYLFWFHLVVILPGENKQFYNICRRQYIIYSNILIISWHVGHLIVMTSLSSQ